MFTAVWQAFDFREREWICELFGSHITSHLYDGNHEVVQDNCILFDKFIHTRNRAYYAKFAERSRVFLFHLSDEQYHGGYDIYRWFNGVFRNYWSAVFTESILIVPLGYSNGHSRPSTMIPASSRHYVWSFAGETERASRPEMVSALSEIVPSLCHSTGEGARSLSPSDYRDLMLDTIFAPSPMGRINLECFRLYEALELGCIPIVEKRPTLDYFRHLLGSNPLLTVRNWSEARRKVEELLGDPMRLDALQEEIMFWWQTRKRFVSEQISTMLTKGPATRTNQPATRAAYHLPLWQHWELARHHSTRALARRAGVQVQRALSRIF
jgi:hypothetical protein